VSTNPALASGTSPPWSGITERSAHDIVTDVVDAG
jgi:hypothetical protein